MPRYKITIDGVKHIVNSDQELTDGELRSLAGRMVGPATRPAGPTPTAMANQGLDLVRATVPGFGGIPGIGQQQQTSAQTAALRNAALQPGRPVVPPPVMTPEAVRKAVANPKSEARNTLTRYGITPPKIDAEHRKPVKQIKSMAEYRQASEGMNKSVVDAIGSVPILRELLSTSVLGLPKLLADTLMGKPIMEAAKTAGAEGIAPIAMTPAQIAGNLSVASGGIPDATPADKWWATGELALDTMPIWGHAVSELALSPLLKAIKSAFPEVESLATLKTAIKDGRQAARLQGALEQAKARGVPKGAIDEFFGHDDQIGQMLEGHNPAAKVEAGLPPEALATKAVPKVEAPAIKPVASAPKATPTFEQYAQVKASGGDTLAWREAHGVDDSTFSQWQKKFRADQEASEIAASSAEVAQHQKTIDNPGAATPEEIQNATKWLREQVERTKGKAGKNAAGEATYVDESPEHAGLKKQLADLEAHSPPPDVQADPAGQGALPKVEGSVVDGGAKEPWQMTRKEFEATGEDYMHGTPRQPDVLKSGQKARMGSKPSNHVYFTGDENIADRFSKAGRQYSDWDSWLERKDDVYGHGEEQAALDGYREAIQKRIDKGDHVTYTTPEGNEAVLKDVSKVSDGDIKEAQVFYAKNAPSIIKTKLYGRTVDLTGDNIPANVPDWLKEYGNKKRLPNFTHEYDPKIAQWMRENGVGKLIVGDTYESGFKSTIGIDEFIGHGRDAHREFVANAFKDGKPVPPEVLADYPDLAKGAKPVEAAPAPVEVAPATSKPPTEPPVKPPPVEKGAEPSTTGVAKQVTGRPAQKGTTVDEIAAEGRNALEEGTVDPKAIATQVKESGKPMTDVELSATGARLRQIENQSIAIQNRMLKSSDPAELAHLNGEIDRLAAEAEHLKDAADISMNKGFHRLGMASQVVYKPDFSLASLAARAKGALLGTFEHIPIPIRQKLAAFSDRIIELEGKLSAAREDLAKSLLSGKTGGSTVPATRRARNVSTLKKYFGEEAGKIDMATGGRSSKRSGAVSYTIADTDREAMRAVRALAKDLADGGAKDLDAVLAGIRQTVGVSVPDETLLRMLSDPYRKHMIEADVAKMRTNGYLRDLQRGAEYRLKSPTKKAFEGIGNLFTTTQRSMQAGMDLSAAFIQGRKGLFANPQSWLRAWRPMVEATIKGDEVALAHLADVSKHPMYAKSKAAGLELAEPGGRFTAQEEQFAGNFVRAVLEKQKGKYNPVRIYFQALENSDAAYSTFLNRLRYDTFVKLAAAAPDNPAYLRDVANTINTIYGRGASKTAKAIGSMPGAGNVFYAPRYTVSSFEYAAGRPVWSAETALGRKAALKIYATQAAAYGSLVLMAKMAGWDVNTDVRSPEFGMTEVPTPQGKMKVDLFSKEGQAYRLVGQLLYGKVGKNGSYKEPNFYNNTQVIGQFAVGKAAPGASMVSRHIWGQFDPDEGTREATGWDDLFRYLPIWVQGALDKDNWKNATGTVPLNIIGIDAKPGETNKKGPPLDVTRPGIYQPKK